MQTNNSIPYPRPDFTDGDLISKEMVNGTFGLGMFSDLKNFKPPLERYNVTADKLTDASILHGNIQPQDYDLSMSDVTIDRVKELGWLPSKRDTDVPEPLVVYDPLKHYSFVEWVGINSTELPDIASTENVRYTISDAYYDDDNAGLFGLQTIKDDDGNITDIFGVFFSLKTQTLAVLGRLPDGLNLSASRYVGYVNGTYIINFYGGTYVSITLDGEVYTLTGYSDYNTCLGDDGVIAIEKGDKTFIFDKKFEPERDPETHIIRFLDGRFCVRSDGFSSSPTNYLFGTKIGSTYFFLKDNESSYKFKKTKLGWKAEIAESRAWAYSKRLKYDYTTNNWLQKPLKTLKYNMIKQGLFIKGTFPPHEKGDEIEFVNSDMHGDFARVVSNGVRKYWHTFNFKEWKPLTGDAVNYLYGCRGRLWIKDRVDGVSGLMPYTLVVKSVINGYGGYKTVLQFSGFIFRGEQ